MLTVPANVTDRGDTSIISTHTSDMIELVSGVCKVRIIPEKIECSISILVDFQRRQYTSILARKLLQSDSI